MAEVLDFIVIFFLVGFILIGVYVIWVFIPIGEEIRSEKYTQEISGNYPEQSYQFYPNLRYRDKEITFSLSESCENMKRKDVINAFKIIEDKTDLDFTQTLGEGEIKVECSNIAPEADESNHFIAGEGGPSKIINTSVYNVIFNGKVSLYRSERCETPNVAIHEILHALGFDHNNDKNSILYPITNCNQEIDQYILDEINRVYANPSLPDLLFKEIEASRKGRYLSFEATLFNAGLKDSKESKIQVLINDELVKEFIIEQMDIGVGKTLSVSNLRSSSSFNEVSFKIVYDEDEISKENNLARVGLIEG